MALPKPGEGPSEEARLAGSFDMLFIGIAEDGEQVRVSVHGDQDPGYGSTAKMLAETALCLLASDDVTGGMWTPVAALEQRLADRLENYAGLTLTDETTTSRGHAADDLLAAPAMCCRSGATMPQPHCRRPRAVRHSDTVLCSHVEICVI